jgi:ribosomal-protein-alanine N-acetyltransferase
MRIETERLVLRPLEPGDLDGFAPIFADPEVMRFIGDGTGTRDETAEWLERWIATFGEIGRGHLAVTLRDTDELIGRCGLVLRELAHGRETEISYLLGRDRWGRGYATEAARAVRDHAFDELGERRLVSLIAEGNHASEAVARRIGMALERRLEFHGRASGMWVIERS